MSLQIGQQLGSFEITSLIGKGGMGEVYRAKDTKLKRDVAIKILPDEFSRDTDRAARFQREAESLAALNHQNIAAIYDLQQSDATRFLILEFVEGETLADRIARGPLPLDESLNIAKQICEALEAAHEKGIIHRDLKPANVKITSDGKVKVLDFGLAKAFEAQGSQANLSQSPTLSMAATNAGVILGTAAYMSPEQAKGRQVDRRTDIFAFGAVLYEMLTGQRAFAGDDVSEVLASVLARDPDWARLPATLSPALGMYMRRCLHKDPRQRIHDIVDVRLALEGAFETVPQTTAPTPERRRRAREFIAVPVSALAGVLVAAAALWSWGGRAPSGAAPAPTRLSVVLPANRPFGMYGFPTRSLTLSADGTLFVYVGTKLDASADQPGGRTQLQLRSLGSPAVRDLSGTAGARQPFFSPDGQWVGFFTETGELKKASVAGGNPVTLLEKINAGQWGFGVWTEDNTIIFGTVGAALRRISAEGGEATALTTLDAAQGELYHYIPALVPSSRAVLFSVRYRELRPPRIEAVMLDSGERRVVVENASSPLVLSSGHLLFQRDEAILIAPFDTRRLTVTGPAVPLVDEVRRDAENSTFLVPQLAVSRGGTLAYVPAVDTSSTLGLVGRDGAFTRLGPPPSNFDRPRMSPDGHAVAVIETRGKESEVYVYDLARGNTTKLTQEGVDSGIAWHPDSRSLAIFSRKKDGSGIFLKNLDGGERLLVPLRGNVVSLRNLSWSPDGKVLAYTAQTGSQHDIWVLTTGDTPTAKPFLNTAASEYSPKFSPDGRWLAYVSDESGRPEVYLRRYPQGERLAVSTGGGNGPVWKPDGREIFFQGLSEGVPKLMAVSVTPEGEALRLAKPVPLFDMRVQGPTGVIEEYKGSSNSGVEYDILPDGKRFVMIKGADPTGAREILLVQNWFEELKRLVPTN